MEAGGTACGSADSIRLAAVGVCVDPGSRIVLQTLSSGARRRGQYATVGSGVESFGVFVERGPARWRGRGEGAFQCESGAADGRFEHGSGGVQGSVRGVPR